MTTVTAVNRFNCGFVTASRFMYATAREGRVPPLYLPPLYLPPLYLPPLYLPPLYLPPLYLPPLFSRLNDRAVPWVPVLALGIASFVLAVVVQVVGGAGWQVLVAVGATLEAMIYAVAAFCVLRLRARMPDHHRPFRVRVVMPLAGVGIAVFGTLALVPSVTVANRVDPAPLVVIAVVGAASGWYVVRVVPRLRAAEEARRAARTRRRPSRSAGGTAGPS